MTVTATEIIHIRAAADRLLLTIRSGEALGAAHVHLLPIRPGERILLAGRVHVRTTRVSGGGVAKAARALRGAVIQSAVRTSLHRADRCLAAGRNRLGGVGLLRSH